MSAQEPGGPYAAGFLRGLGRKLGGLLGGEREPGLVNHISLGAHCQMAHVLKTLDLRAWSGPFDWIFTMPGMVRDCLADDFAALIDRSQLETIPEAEQRGEGIWRGRHRLYRERYGLDCVFNHHDPAADDADYRFLTEGVRRLRAALANPAAENRFWILTHLHTPPGDRRRDLRRFSAARSGEPFNVSATRAGKRRPSRGRRRADPPRSALAHGGNPFGISRFASGRPRRRRVSRRPDRGGVAAPPATVPVIPMRLGMGGEAGTPILAVTEA